MWELGNEENQIDFWKPAPDAAQYAIWYKALYHAIHNADPTARVAIGGLGGFFAGCCIPGRVFLKAVIDRGVRPDAVAIHPYTSREIPPDVHEPWADNFDDIGLVNEFLERRRLDVDVWVTEWGWSSSYVGADRQAAYLATSLKMIATRFPFVTVATTFIDRDRPPEYSQGLFDAHLRPKPAAIAFATFMRSLGRPAAGVGAISARGSGVAFSQRHEHADDAGSVGG